MGIHLSNCPVGIHFQGGAAGSLVIQVRGRYQICNECELNLITCPTTTTTTTTTTHPHHPTPPSPPPQDSSFTDIPLGVQTDYPTVVRGLLLENVTFTRVATVASGFAGNAAGTTVIPLWSQVRNVGGHVPALQ